MARELGSHQCTLTKGRENRTFRTHSDFRLHLAIFLHFRSLSHCTEGRAEGFPGGWVGRGKLDWDGYSVWVIHKAPWLLCWENWAMESPIAEYQGLGFHREKGWWGSFSCRPLPSPSPPCLASYCAVDTLLLCFLQIFSPLPLSPYHGIGLSYFYLETAVWSKVFLLLPLSHVPGSSSILSIYETLNMQQEFVICNAMSCSCSHQVLTTTL